MQSIFQSQSTDTGFGRQDGHRASMSGGEGPAQTFSGARTQQWPRALADEAGVTFGG